MSLNTIETVLYDNDGVNIESEEKAMRICDDFLSKMVADFFPNAPFPPNYIYKEFPGRSTNKIAVAVIQEKSIPLAAIKEAYGFSEEYLKQIPIDEEFHKDEELKKNPELHAVGFALANLITLDTCEEYKKSLKAIPGVPQMHEEVRELVGKKNVHLVTTSRADRMNVSLAYAVDPVTGNNADLSNTFPEGENRLSGYGKANKYDLKFQLAEEAGQPLDPNKTVIVEDSKGGTEYAKAGRPGVRVIGTVASNFYTDKEDHARKLVTAGANVVVSDMRDFVSVLKWLDVGLDPEQRPEGLSGTVYTKEDFEQSPNLQVTLQVGNQAPRPPEVA